MRIVNHTELNNLGAVTITAWVMPRMDNHGHVLDKGDGDKCLLPKGSGHRLMGLIRYASSQPSTCESIDNTLTLNTWPHVALTWNHADHRIRLYHRVLSATEIQKLFQID